MEEECSCSALISILRVAIESPGRRVFWKHSVIRSQATLVRLRSIEEEYSCSALIPILRVVIESLGRRMFWKLQRP